MVTNLGDVERLVKGMSFDNKATATNGQISLREAVQELIESATLTASRAEHVQSLAADVLNSPLVTETVVLYRIINKLRKITHNLDDTTWTAERSIIAHLSSLGGEDRLLGASRLQAMLLHFDKELRSIVRGVLERSSDGKSALWMIAEECYVQAADTSGTLHPDNYFDPLEEADPEWPYDPDFESEEYYEHENRLWIDDG